MVVKSPLKVQVGKKYFPLNLNQYRNTFYQTLNTAKITYKELLKDQLVGLKLTPPVSITYTLYPRDNRLCDLGNVLSIHQKFFEDALVSYKCLPEDTYIQIPQVIYQFGSICKEDPRVDILIKEIK